VLDDEMFDKDLESVIVEHEYEEEGFIKQENNSP
jgi:hypothetical protein